MESLIAKQNISRRFRSAPGIKKAAIPASFPLGGQKTAKRASAAQRFFQKAPAPRTGPRGGQNGPKFKLPKPLKEFFWKTPILPGEKSSRTLIIVCAGLAAMALAFAACLLALSWTSSRFPVSESDFELPALPAGMDLLTVLEESSPTEDFQPDSGMIAMELPMSLSVSYHTLKRGETIGTVAKLYGRTQDSIISMNGIVNVKRVASGTKLKIPNMDGIIHVVASGESLGKISGRYKVAMTSILDANNLESYTIRKGQSLFIPGAKMDKGTLKQALGDLFSWPIRSLITSSFGYRPDPFTGVRRFHGAIDLYGTMGQRVNAAMDGRVVEKGYNVNYGNYIILAHDGGFQTCYAHLSEIDVKDGQSVGRGSKIGEVGNSGYSTGAHLHFAVYRKGSAVNPLGFLPK
jgi:murein DD-endopeptidase MepM/ murein hydrolase activator NlpD